jgi:hypothetical protein
LNRQVLVSAGLATGFKVNDADVLTVGRNVDSVDHTFESQCLERMII